MQYFEFDGHRLSRIFKGNWQLAGGHGAITPEQAIETMFVYVEHGVNVFDVGDIYTGAEELVGTFLKQYRQRFGADATNKLRVHTKFVPDLDALDDLQFEDVRAIIQRSCQRLGLERLHLVQFHWWNYDKGDFVQAAKYLDRLRQDGLIETIGLTNFDCGHAQQLLDAGVPIKSNQVQFSLIDPRAFNGMLELGQKHDIAIFCYGVLAGGLLGSSRPGDEPTNRSHVKYKLVIDEVGQGYYESVLNRLEVLAEQYKTTIANVATAYVLQTPGVSSAILGPRNTAHAAELDTLTALTLSDADYRQLHRLEQELLKKNKDDVYSYERDTDGPHGQIMKYNLNGMRPSVHRG